MTHPTDGSASRSCAVGGGIPDTAGVVAFRIDVERFAVTDRSTKPPVAERTVA